MSPEQMTAINEVVWVDPDRMHGTPCFRGTRVPVQTLIDHWEGGSTLEEFLSDFPTVSRTQALKFIELAKERLLECVSS